MIEIIQKDITTVKSGMVVHGCNCSGGFGSGVAGAIKKKWPEVEKQFKLYKNPRLGELLPIDIDSDLIICNAYTQNKYGYDGSIYANLEAISISIQAAIDIAVNNNIKDIYMPKIGCGLGGLDWNDVYNEIKRLDHNNVNIHVCVL